MNEAKSVIARLKNESKKSGKSLQLHLQLFCQEEVLRRIAKSSYAENFILKGGLLIYTLSGYQGRATVDMDFGVGDVIIPNTEKRKIITQLDTFEVVEIITYSLESTVAEKIDAILQRFELTSRMKDFYDIYYIGSTFDFNGKILSNAVKETINNRGTKIESDSFDRIKNLKNNTVLLSRWKVFQTKFSIELSFEDAIDFLEVFMSDILYAIALEHKFEGNWQSKNQIWEFELFDTPLSAKPRTLP